MQSLVIIVNCMPWLCHHRKLPLFGAAPCTLLLLFLVASGRRGLLVPPAQKAKRHVPRGESLMLPPALFLLATSRRMKKYFNQVKPMRHETDGGSHSAKRFLCGSVVSSYCSPFPSTYEILLRVGGSTLAWRLLVTLPFLSNGRMTF